MFDSDRKLNLLITTWEGGGSVGPMLTLARKLRDAGHAVRVMSDACNRPETEATGVRFIPWTRAPSRADRSRDSELIRDWAAASPAEGFAQAIEQVFAGPAYAYAEDVIEELSREAADLVVTNDFLFGVMAGCESIGQPVVAMACNINLFPVDDAPVTGPGESEALSPEEAAQEAMMVEGFRAVFDTGLPALNTARALLHLKPLDRLLDQLACVRTTLVSVSKYFDMVREPVPSGYRYVGPQIDDAAWTDAWDDGSSRSACPDAWPLVLVSFSTTFQNHVAVLQRVIDGLSPLPVRVVVTLGPTIAPEELSPASNTRLVRSAPHGPLMREAALLITHGGHGTLARAMVNRLPMLVLPHGRDQDGNAARIVARGAGLMLPPTASAMEIGDATVRIIGDPTFATAAKVLGDHVARETEQSDIVQQIEQLCRCRAFA